MQLKRGFVGVGVLIAILVGLAVLGGGAYYVVHQQSATQIPADNFNNEILPTTNIQPSQQTQATANTTMAASAPTCLLTVKIPTITKNNISGTNSNFEIAQGQSATISWSTTNADYGGVVEAGKFPSGEAGTILASGSGSVSPTMDTTYVLKFEGKNGQVKCGATIKVTGGAPSATVDKSSLTDTSGTPTLSGTASNVMEVSIQVAPKAKVVGGEFITAKVGNGRWSAPFSKYVAPLVTGEYTVIVRTLDSNVLTTETLSVNILATQNVLPFFVKSPAYSIHPQKEDWLVISADGPDMSVDLTGWSVRSTQSGKSFTIAPLGGTQKVAIGSRDTAVFIHTIGSPTKNYMAEGEWHLYFGQTTVAWDAEHDIIQLVNPSGSVVDTYSY